MIRNLRNQEVIIQNHYILKGLFEKGKGLMFKPKSNLAYIFEFEKCKRVDFHTSFVFFPIDMVFLDENKKVLKVRTGVRPFRFISDTAMYVIELVSNPTLNIKIGDTLQW